MSAQTGRFRVLVTGGDGFVGRHLVRALAAALPDRSEVIVGSLARDASPDTGPARQVALDITDADEVRAVIAAEQPTHLFHLAAIAAVSTAQRNVRQTWAVNFGGTLNIAIAVSEAAPACRVLYCSSAEVYGANFRSGLALSENAPLDPINPYGASKAAADLMIGQMSRQGLRAIRLRPFNHIGPGQRRHFVVPDFASQIAAIEHGTQEPVMRVGNLTARRDFLDVRDVVDAYVRAVLRFDDLPPGEPINIASGRAISIRDVLDILVSLSSKKIEIVEDPALMRSNDTPVVVGDAGRARGLLGWAPRLSISDTLAAVLDDCRGARSA